MTRVITIFALVFTVASVASASIETITGQGIVHYNCKILLKVIDTEPGNSELVIGQLVSEEIPVWAGDSKLISENALNKAGAHRGSDGKLYLNSDKYRASIQKFECIQTN